MDIFNQPIYKMMDELRGEVAKLPVLHWIGGNFSPIHVSAPHIAKWNGAAWVAIEQNEHDKIIGRLTDTH